MNYRIMQLPITNNNIFQDYSESTFEYQDYVCVWDDTTEALATKETCEDLYYKFNMQKPRHFGGHSMSVSDLIIFYGEGKKKIVFYCQSVGFENITEKI